MEWVVIIAGIVAIGIFALTRGRRKGNRKDVGDLSSEAMEKKTAIEKYTGNGNPFPKKLTTWDEIPHDVRDLLLVSMDQPADFNAGLTITITIDIERGFVSHEEKQPDDPSTIYARLPIDTHADISKVERPPYYPSYAMLTPQQKWAYLSWLKNVDAEIDIGFVFVFYYGLERQLLLGNFDSSFDMIMRLRRHHSNGSFQAYSAGGLVYGSVYRNRPDRLDDLIWMLDEPKWDSEQLLICSRKSIALKAQYVVSTISGLTNLNRRYLTSERETYEAVMHNVLSEKYGDPILDLNRDFPFLELGRSQKMLFANYTFPEEVRNPVVPDYLHDSKFLSTLSELHEKAHEKTKNILREKRKRRTT